MLSVRGFMCELPTFHRAEMEVVAVEQIETPEMCILFYMGFGFNTTVVTPWNPSNHPL